MEINSTLATSVSQLVNSTQAQPAAAKPAQQTSQVSSSSPSTVVSLSSAGQALSRADAQNQTQQTSALTPNTANVNTERGETRPQESSEPPGIQLMESEKSWSSAAPAAATQISTYA